MPVIKVWCLPQLEEDALRELHKDIVAAVVSVKELNLRDERDMTVLFPVDMMSYGLGTEIIVEITGLDEKPERTKKVLKSLSFVVGGAVKANFLTAKVECFVYPFNHDQCAFWSSN